MSNLFELLGAAIAGGVITSLAPAIVGKLKLKKAAPKMEPKK